MKSQKIIFDSMGTKWEITFWENVSSSKLSMLEKQIRKMADEFDSTYSRFKKDSFVWKIENKTGKIQVPFHFIQMLFLYMKLNQTSHGIINPLIGNSISDLGYDKTYSLKHKKTVRETPNLFDTIQILDQNYIKKTAPCLFDFGALGKGYFVDVVSAFLFQKKYNQFLVNGSGDIYYQGEEKITAGLEHPEESKKIVGTLSFKNKALCASGINRRKWENVNHIINPFTNTSQEEILATWVLSNSAAISDGIATALFFCPPENFLDDFQFEYLILNKEYKVKRSKGFNAKLF